MREKKVLIVASVASFIYTFNRDNVWFLSKTRNCELHIACNFSYTINTDGNVIEKFVKELKSEGVHVHDIPFARSPFSMQNVSNYKLLKKIIEENSFDLIHVHTPTVSILTRLAARKAHREGTIVMYTCHGFHFHKASPKKNWLMYYPMEKIMSRFCDYIVTINKEDYKRASNFSAPNVRYIPGVGVDLKRISDCIIDRDLYKQNLGIPSDGVLILSVGEMIVRKNHEVIIKAMSHLKNPSIYYAICGRGPLKEYLQKIAINGGVKDNVLFLGYRHDIPELYKTADIGALPSLIEGLGLAGIESLAAGTPLISSNVHGILDYVFDGKNGFACPPHDVDAFATAIKKLASSKELRDSMRHACIEAVKPFEKQHALEVMWSIYDEALAKSKRI